MLELNYFHLLSLSTQQYFDPNSGWLPKRSDLHREISIWDKPSVAASRACNTWILILESSDSMSMAHIGPGLSWFVHVCSQRDTGILYPVSTARKNTRFKSCEIWGQPTFFHTSIFLRKDPRIQKNRDPIHSPCLMSHHIGSLQHPILQRFGVEEFRFFPLETIEEPKKLTFS